MAHAHSNSNNDYANATVTATGDNQQKLTATFHDFLGTKGQNTAPAAGGGGRPSSEVSPSASASLNASSYGGRAPISTTSDLGSGNNTRATFIPPFLSLYSLQYLYFFKWAILLPFSFFFF